VSYGTVATVGDNGEVDYTDPAAVLVTGDGVDVDVYLEPLGIPVTANYVGLQGGKKVSIFSPIKPGDRVLVVLPDGDTLGPPAIVAILHSAHDRLPLGTDNLPIFQNDRLLIHSDGQDVDVRVKDADATFIADNVKIGGRDADEPLVLGNRWKTRMESLYSDLAAHKHGTPAGPSGPPFGPEQVAWASTEPGQLPGDISDTNFTKKTNDGQ